MAIRISQIHKQIDKKIASNVIKLATPVVLSNISRTMMSFVDVMMVGHLGSKALAATGMGSMVVWTMISFSIGLRTATQTVSSRRLGQQNFAECGTALRNGILLSLCYGVPVSLLGYMSSGWIAQFLLNETQVSTLARDYISIGFLGVLF